MSGGVDSSVTAWLLKEQGYDCVGAIMRLHDGPCDSDAAAGAEAEGSGPGDEPDDVASARAVAERLGMPLFPGMREILERLREKGASLGIITSKLREEYDEHFEKQGLLELFPCVVTASDTPKGKPYPDPMLEYLRRTGAAPEEVLYFGDTAYDMDCARSAGVDHALVLWGCLSPEGIEATYRLEKAEEILEFA